MKKIMRIFSILCLLLTVVCSGGWSMDFVDMSNKELFELRGAIQNAPDVDKNSYQLEWEKRIAVMTNEEKKQFVDSPKHGEGKEGSSEQLWVPARGYEKQAGQVILGGYPENGGSSR